MKNVRFLYYIVINFRRHMPSKVAHEWQHCKYPALPEPYRTYKLEGWAGRPKYGPSPAGGLFVLYWFLLLLIKKIKEIRETLKSLKKWKNIKEVSKIGCRIFVPFSMKLYFQIKKSHESKMILTSSTFTKIFKVWGKAEVNIVNDNW